MTELEPCPECESDDLSIMTEHTSGNRVIHCNVCHKYYDKLKLTREDTPSDIISKWNEYAQNYDPNCNPALMTEPGLKPCPFCGTEPKVVRDSLGKIMIVRCLKCVLRMYILSNGDVSKWNRRVKE